jgi:hypothetical protein
LIPAIILWRSTSGYLFAIDGSHRLSSLFAWINDDYGDGKITKLFYDGVIPDDQIEIAENTRKLINKKIGSYEDYKLASSHPEKVKPDIVKRAKNLAALAIQLQWVEGDASIAENSFFKINQQAAPIDKTELKLLKSRKKPNSIAARAIIRSGKGHKYWSCFPREKQEEIQELAREINKILFDPKLITPIKTLDIPIGGKLYSAQALPLILDFVNVANQIDPNSNELEEDSTGERTTALLKQTRKIAWLLNSNHASSLGLHPIIYFYSQDGRYKIASFFAIVDLIMGLESRKKINDFVKARGKFEEVIQRYDYLVQQINRRHRSAQASYKHISSFFRKIIESINAGNTIDSSINNLINTDGEYSYLTLMTDKEIITTQTDFSTNKKSAVFIQETIRSAPRCKICNGLIHRNSISIDHIHRKVDGGVASIDNAQLTHPYCNTGFKN